MLLLTIISMAILHGSLVAAVLLDAGARCGITGQTSIAAPARVDAIVGDGANALQWSAVPGASGYIVYRAPESDGSPTPVAYTTGVSLTDRVPAHRSGVYTYSVAAVSGLRSGASSDPVAASIVRIEARVEADRSCTIRASTGEVSLYLPAGTFAEDTTVTISEVSGLAGGPDSTRRFMTGAYDFGPEGAVFGGSRPQVTFGYTVARSDESFERDWISKTARIFYSCADGSGWEDVTSGLSLDVESDTVSGELSHFSTYACGYTIMPHGRYTADSELCDACHDLHAAPNEKLGARADLDLCYYCHGADLSTSGASGAHGPNIQAEFMASSDQELTAGDSRHPVEEHEMNCPDCHTLHRDPDEYPKLLYAWEADGTKTYVDDASGVIGNAFCFGCHGSFDNTSINATYYADSGGDHETVYAGPHATYSYEPSATNDTTCSITPTNGSGIQCLACHQRHGADGAGYLNAVELGDAADGESLCYGCHPYSGTAATWNGRYIAREFARASAHDVTGATGAQLECASCHNAHTVQAGDGDEWDLTRAADPDDITASISDPVTLCLRCHDGSAPTKTITASVIVPYTVSFPDWSASPYFTGFDKSAFNSGGHGDRVASNDAIAGCDNCHDPHASDNARLTAFFGGHFTQGHRTNTLVFGEERLCYGCHNFGGVNCYTSSCHQYMPDIAPQMRKTSATYADWSTSVVETAPTTIYALGSGDIDGDSSMDFVSGGRYIYWHNNVNGNGTSWTSTPIFSTSNTLYFYDLAVVDVGGSASLDVPALRTNGQLFVAIATAADGSSWNFQYIASTGTAAGDLDTGDIDGDSDVDMITASKTTTGGALRMWRNDATTGLSWTPIDIALPAANQKAVAIGDIDDDDDLDFVAGGDDSTITLYENTAGNGSTWTTSTVSAVGASVGSLALSDVDNDGDLDVVSGTASGARVYENLAGDGTSWSAVSLAGGGGTPYRVSVGDINGDGYSDVAFTSGSGVVWYRNYGAANAWTSALQVTTLPNWSYGVHVADIDGDGDADVMSGIWGNGAAPTTRYHSSTVGEPFPRPGAHPAEAYSGRHSSTETASDFGTGNRHAECVDCHDVHLVKRGTHTMGTNLASNSIYGSRGVLPAARAAWASPASYTESVVTYEYELCYKCHSSYTTGYTGEDKAKEFNPVNLATHPIEGVGNNLGVREESFVLGTPWNPTAGDDGDYSAASAKMTCTDCHASESEADPRGPHGSTIAHVLRATASTSTVGDLSESVLCFLCHDSTVYGYTSVNPGAGGSQPAESAYSRVNHRHFYYQGAQCIECHYPHGRNIQHLMKGTYIHDPAGGTMRTFTSCDAIGSCHSSGTQKGYTSNY